MSSFSDTADCPKNCWIMGGVIGVVLFLIFWILAGWGVIWALIAGLIVFVAAAFILQMLMCKEGQGSGASTAQPMANPATAVASQPTTAVEPEPVMADPEPVATEEPAPEPIVEDPTPAPEPVAVESEPEPDLVAATPDPIAELVADAPEVAEGAAQQPNAMDAAREGGPDDLKRIKGVGPKLEILLNSLGIFHFDQIAAWGASEVAWMDDNLAGFKGRVTRDTWVAQAGLLATGEETDFSRKVDDGNVY